jgi:outer membrane protein OmpA-like peptidoglycan-associated protein
MNPARRAVEQNGNASPDEQLIQLRALLMGPDLDALRSRLDDPAIRAEETSRIIAEAIALRAARGGELRHALQSSIEEALRISVQRDPHVLAGLLFPVIGPAIRNAVASSLSGMLDALDKMLEQSLSLRSLQWRVESWRTGKPFAEIVILRSLLYRVEQVFLIHRQTGLLLRHETAEAAVIRDADLVSGMLTAIQDFVRDSFGSEEGKELENMQVGDFQVWVAHGPKALLAGVVRGVPPRQLASLIQDRLERIHESMGSALDDFDGDAAPFVAARPILQSCLTGQLARERRRGPRMLYLAAAALALLLIAALGFFHFRDQRRWSAYLDRLNAEPGIVVTSAQSGLRGHTIAGLRDPLAADPAALLEGTGIARDEISAHWAPYDSPDPRFAALRRFETETQLVERQAIFFRTGNADVATEMLWPVINEIHLLLEAAQAVGRQVNVEVTGSTDPFGPDALNAKLGQERAGRVTAELIRQGIPAERLVTRAGAIASKTAGDQDEWQRRRVSFRVVPAP